MANQPLIPRCEPPHLQPYNHDGTADITFLEKVGAGLHSHVFKVQIDDRVFALKVFNLNILFSDWIIPTSPDGPEPDVDVELLTAQWHPFNAECRAYARLKEAEKEHLAVRCHGYLCLTDAQKTEVEDRFGIGSWWHPKSAADPDYPDPEWQQKIRQEEGRPLRAIVKDFVNSKVHFGFQHAPMMLKDLHQLHRCGIVVGDIKEDAYVDGKLVDFSQAVVVPHMKFSTIMRAGADYKAKSAVHEDLGTLGSWFEDWNDEHPDGPQITCKTLPGQGAVSRLRRGSLTQREAIARSFNPLKVQWQKFTQRPRGSAVVEAKYTVGKRSDTTEEKHNGVHKGKAMVKNKKTQ